MLELRSNFDGLDKRFYHTWSDQLTRSGAGKVIDLI